MLGLVSKAIKLIVLIIERRADFKNKNARKPKCIQKRYFRFISITRKCKKHLAIELFILFLFRVTRAHATNLKVERPHW